MRSVLALAVAVAMVTGAMLVRDAIDGGAEVGDILPGAEAPVRVACLAELRGVCEDLAATGEAEVTVASAAAQLDELDGEDGEAPPYDAWLTFAPVAQLARDRSARTPGATTPLGEDGAVLARSPAVLAVWDERADVLLERCPDADWGCVGELAPGDWEGAGGPASWGALKPGVSDPAVSATGALVLAQQAGGFFGSSGFTATNLRDPGFFTWFADLQRAVPTFRPPAGSPLLAMVQTGAATFDVVATLESEVVDLQRRAPQRTEGVRLVQAAPVVTADVIAVGLGADGDDAVERLSELAPDALAGRGWRVPGVTAEGVELPPVDLPDGDGLPNAGVLEALRTTFAEVTR